MTDEEYEYGTRQPQAPRFYPYQDIKAVPLPHIINTPALREATPKDFLSWKFDKVVEEMKKILLTKHELRGSKNITEQGLMGVVNRIVLDKGSRVRNEVELAEAVRVIRKKIPDFSLEEKSGNQDSLEDDLLDMANYCIIALLLLRNQWE